MSIAKEAMVVGAVCGSLFLGGWLVSRVDDSDYSKIYGDGNPVVFPLANSDKSVLDLDADGHVDVTGTRTLASVPTYRIDQVSIGAWRKWEMEVRGQYRFGNTTVIPRDDFGIMSPETLARTQEVYDTIRGLNEKLGRD